MISKNRNTLITTDALSFELRSEHHHRVSTNVVTMQWLNISRDESVKRFYILVTSARRNLCLYSTDHYSMERFKTIALKLILFRRQ